MPIVNPAAAFVLALAGLLLIYFEFIWIGKIIFGFAGSLLFLIGAAALSQLPEIHARLPLFLVAFSLFALEAVRPAYFIPGILATSMLAWNATKTGIQPWVCLPASIIFGFITVALLAVAKQARNNKRADL